MLESARDQHRKMAAHAAKTVALARLRRRDRAATARLVRAGQARAIALTIAGNAAMLAEQGIDAPPEAPMVPLTLITPAATVEAMLANADQGEAWVLDRIVATLIQDAGRTATAVDIGRRLGVNAQVRALNPPSCARCVVLAGRVYGRGAGFARHPLCDCIGVPTTQAVAPDLVVDPTEMLERGLVRGLSKADTEAVLTHGADLGRVVNVRGRAAGLKVGSSVTQREGRHTPAGILAATDGDPEATLRALRKHGYLAA